MALAARHGVLTLVTMINLSIRSMSGYKAIDKLINEDLKSDSFSEVMVEDSRGLIQPHFCETTDVKGQLKLRKVVDFVLSNGGCVILSIYEYDSEGSDPVCAYSVEISDTKDEKTRDAVAKAPAPKRSLSKITGIPYRSLRIRK